METECGTIGDQQLSCGHWQSMEHYCHASGISLEVGWYYGRQSGCLVLVVRPVFHQSDSCFVAFPFYLSFGSNAPTLCAPCRQYFFVNGFFAAKLSHPNASQALAAAEDASEGPKKEKWLDEVVRVEETLP